MKINEQNDFFWKNLEEIVFSKEIIIDRPKGSKHPKYSDFIYPVDYGYVKGMISSDGNDMDIWRGTKVEHEINGILCTVDMIKKDMEIKILLSCTKEEIERIYQKMNEKGMNAIIKIRNK